MTITTRIEAVRLPLAVPMATGHGAIRHRQGLLVALGDGEHTGWGEASPLPGWSKDSLADTELALRHALDPVEDDGDVSSAVAGLHDRPHARAAVSGAWADLIARRDGVPLARSLSARGRDVVEVNSVLAAGAVDELERAAAESVAGGFTTIKVKVGAGAPAGDVERIRAVRRGAPHVDLRLDANQAWDRSTAVEVLRAAVGLDIAWCEEPTGVLDEFGAIESETGVRVAADESVVSETGLRKALALGLTVIVVKPQAIGGPDRAARVAGLAAEAGALVVITSFMDSAVGVAHAVHVASAHGGPVAHGLATTGFLARDVGPPPLVERGSIRVPDRPGIGVDPEIGPDVRAGGARPA